MRPLNIINGNIMKSNCISILGTGSDVGKSILTTALCRIVYNKGYSVAPFKSQNMSNNSGITPDGLEMGRAQIVQAQASNIVPHVDMNPILLKPTADSLCQVILMGNVYENNTALEYHQNKNKLFSYACDAFDRLKNKYQNIIIEGAGSCAEVNLMGNDIVNFKMAEYANSPVILIADIHRGGVFAQIIGTLSCIDQKYQDQIAGFVINKFRGDIRLFNDGVTYIEKRTGKKVFGVVPYFDNILIDAEDSVQIEKLDNTNSKNIKYPSIGIIKLPHISNFTDFNPLFEIEDINVYFIDKPQNISYFKAIIIPGTKNTRYDLSWLKRTNWADIICEYAKNGGYILGICGGYQMLGQYIHDPSGVESKSGSTRGLSLLSVETKMKKIKTTSITKFSINDIYGTGYEIHMGDTVNTNESSLFNIHSRNNININDYDGAVSSDKKIIGSYIHGLFDNPKILSYWLKNIGLENLKVPLNGGLAFRDKQYNLLADHFERFLNIDSILKLLC